MSDIYSALFDIQKQGIEGLTKDSTNPHFKNTYISLGKLIDTVAPILTDAGILLIQQPTTVDGAPALRTVLYHTESGTSVEDTTPLMLEKDNPQGLGSAITYQRRYSLMSVLGLVADEDDDGNAASRPTRAKKITEVEVAAAKPKESALF